MKGFWGETGGMRYVQVEPDDGGAGLPLIIAIHGRGADATDLSSLAMELSPDGYRGVLPQGPRPVPLAPGWIGWAWYELGEDQAETVVASRDLLLPFVDGTLARLSVPRERAVIAGFSQGAVMALHVGLTAQEPLGAIVAMSGHLPAAEQLTPLLADRRDRRVLVVHGTEDQTLPIERGRRVREILEGAGLQPEYHEFRMGHEISQQSLAVVREFVQRMVPPGAARSAA